LRNFWIDASAPVGAVYDRPQSGELHSFELWAVIDRPYRGIPTRGPATTYYEIQPSETT